MQRGSTEAGRADAEKLSVTQNPELPKQPKLSGTAGIARKAYAEVAQ